MSTIIETPTADLVASVEAHLASTEARIAALHARVPERAQAAHQREAQLAEAQAHVAQLVGAGEALAQQVAAIRARLLIASTDEARVAIEADLAATRQRADEQATALEAARATLHDRAARVSTEEVEAAREAAQEVAELADLEPLLPHLRAELATLRERQGAETLDALRAERAALDRQRDAARIALADADAALATFEQRARATLAPHPAAFQRANGSPMLPRPITLLERVIEARLAMLAILEEGALPDMVGGVPTMAALVDMPARLPLALSGRDSSYWGQRQQVAQVMLSTWRQQLGD
jgi:hypothetical protein